MSLLRVRVGVGLVCVFIALVALAAAPPAGAQARPNVVLILTDDQRWDSLHHMPTVQAELVGKGVWFANAFAADPLCCPSRATFLTGLHAHSTLVYRNDGPFGGYRWFDDSSTIATWLNRAGYRTAFFGKYLPGYDEPAVPPGWDRWLATVNGYFDYTASLDGTYVQFGTTPEEYSTDVYADAAVSFIEADEERPFLVLYAPFAPHTPATPAPRHAEAFPELEPWRPASYDEEDVRDKPRWLQRFPRLTDDRKAHMDGLGRKMLQSLLAVDDGVRRILDTLEASERLRDTIVVYTSDNGLLWGEHRQIDRKVAPYEESIRIPFVIRYDALGHGARAESRMATNLDLAPTFARLAGTRPPRTEGRDLLPLLRNDPGVRWRTQVLIEHLRGTRGNPRAVPTYCGVRSARWKYVVYKTQEEELYDLAADPAELENVVRVQANGTAILKLRRDLRRLCDPPPPGLSLTWLCTHETSATRRVALGSARADTLCGRAGRDRLAGRGGADVVRGRAGDDLVQGGAGGDLLYGGPGRDRLEGGPGRDVLTGGAGRDRLFGGAGADTFQARDRTRDTIACGPGRDLVFADARDVVTASCELVRRPVPPKPSRRP